MKIAPPKPTPDWKKDLHPGNLTSLTEELKKTKKLAILGVGSELMQDDKAGPEITLYLEKKYGNENPKVRIFTGFTTPENFTKAIADFNPGHIIIVDAADLKLAPGEFTDLPIERITDFSLGTHKLSLVMMIKFLKETINPKFSVLAIQYKSIFYAEKMTKEMKTGVKKVSAFLSDIIDNL
ncbi:MAG TPA: hydrogenase maturation protease [Bacteroidales bacterium]|nr:hydrogenase maturation protease [Bacteroidales bacterium]HPS16865.1 hydrogenase maturation protease [Bacteroidales bacterium]